MPALTPAQRQQRRRDKLAAERPARRPAREHDTGPPAATRQSRQEAWDTACDTLSELLESYRAWKLVTPTPAEDLGNAALPGLAGHVLTLTLTTLGLDFGREWFFGLGNDAVVRAVQPPTPTRSLRDLALGAPRLAEENEPARTAEQDAGARAWWAELNASQRFNWQRIANAVAPEDVYHVMRDAIDRMRGGAPRNLT